MNQQAPACDPDAERAVLGGCLLERAHVEEALKVLSPLDFYIEGHGRVFAAIAVLAGREEPVDPLRVSQVLRDQGALDDTGGLPFLLGLADADATPGTWDVPRQALQVKVLAHQRAILAKCQAVIAASGNGSFDAALGELLAVAGDAGAKPAELLPTRCCDFLAAELKTAPWVVERLVSAGGLTLLFSQPGLGKSVLCFEAARCVALGLDFLGVFPTVSGPALYLNPEMPAAQFQRRLADFEVHQPVGDAPLYVLNDSLVLTDAQSFARFKALVEGVAPVVVVLDPLIDALPGVRLADAGEVRTALSPLCNLARQMGFGILGVHHSRKDGGAAGLDSLADSRDFAARADQVLLLQHGGDASDEEGDLLRVTCVKSRWNEAPRPFHVRILNDENGFPILATAEAPNARREVLDVLQTASPGPLSTAQIVSELDGVKNRDQINRALAALHAEGRVGKPKRGLWALVDGGETEP